MAPQGLPARYRLLERLGAGGAGEVWAAEDAVRGEVVALKCAHDAEPDAAVRFGREYWVLATLRHPHLVPVLDYGRTAAGAPYFTMARVAGAPAGVPQDEAAVRAWLPGVVAALDALHALGYGHGDLKPENILVRADGSACVVDLGLLRPLGRAGAIAGTPDYMAPELLQGRAVDGRADLYALGAVLYHVLAGRPPFEAASLSELLRAHLDRPVPALSGVSDGLAAAVVRLMQKDPALRFASGQALLLELGLGAVTTACEGALFGGPIVGRDEVRGRLATGENVLVQGPGGSGRSRLLDEAAARAQVEGRPVLRAGGLGVDAAPYTALRPWFLGLLGAGGRAEWGGVIARLVPVAGIVPAPALDGEAERLRLLAACAGLAATLPAPPVWVLDDADALDPASGALATALLATAPGTWLVGGTRGWNELPAVELAPLVGAEVAAVARGLLGGEPPPGLLDALAVEAEGRPGTIEALVRQWAASGALIRRPDGWAAAATGKFEAPANPEAFVPPSLAARALGEAAAVLGPVGALGDLFALAGLPEEGFYGALAALEAAGVLGVEGMGYRFCRPSLVTAIAAKLDPVRAVALHAAAAYRAAGLPLPGTLPSPSADVPVTLALPSPLTDVPQALAPPSPPADVPPALALPSPSADVPLALALRVARHALAGGLPDAIPWVRQAVDLALAWQAAGAAEELTTAALARPDLAPTDRLALEGVAPLVLRFQGETRAAIALYEGGLLAAMAEAAFPGLADHEVSYATLLQSAGRGAEARAVLADAIARARGKAAVRARFYAARYALFAGEKQAATELLDAALAAAAPYPALLPGLQSLAGYVAGTEGPERAEAALALLAEAAAGAKAQGNPLDAADAASNLGNVCMALGRFDAARAAFQEALVACQRMANAPEALVARASLAAATLELGDLEAAGEEAARALSEARRLGRRFIEGYVLALGGLAAVLAGRREAGLAEGAAALAIAADLDHHYLALHAQAYRAEALAHVGDLTGARAALTAAEALAAALENHEQQDRLTRLAARLARPEVPGASGDASRLIDLAGWMADVALQPTRRAAMARTLEALVAVLGAERGHLLAYHDFRVVEHLTTGVGPEDDATYASGIAYEVLWTGQPLYVADARADERFAGRASVQALALRTVLGVPLADGGAVYGVMLADAAGLDPAFGEGDLPIAALLAHQAGAAIAAAGRLEAAQAEAGRLAATLAVARRALAEPDPSARVRLIMEVARATAEAERALLLGPDEAGCRLAVGSAETHFSTGLRDWALEAGEPTFVLDALEDPQFQSRESIADLAMRSVFLLPVNGLLLYLDRPHVMVDGEARLASLVPLAALLADALASLAPPRRA